MKWYEVSSSTLIHEVDSELVVLNLDTEQYYALNSTARQFLLICDSAPSFHDAAVAISERFGISLERAASDLRALLEALQNRGLLRFSASEAV
jgi:hypothetical protein